MVGTLTDGTYVFIHAILRIEEYHKVFYRWTRVYESAAYLYWMKNLADLLFWVEDNKFCFAVIHFQHVIGEPTPHFAYCLLNQLVRCFHLRPVVMVKGDIDLSVVGVEMVVNALVT